MQSEPYKLSLRWEISDPKSLIDYAIANNLTPFMLMQNHYSLLYREEEREMFPTLKVCNEHSANLEMISTSSLAHRYSASALPRGLPSHGDFSHVLPVLSQSEPVLIGKPSQISSDVQHSISVQDARLVSR